MAKLTRSARHELEAVLRNLQRGERYLFKPDTAIAVKGGVATTTLHYTRPDGAVLYEVVKEYGSDLCGIVTARERLEQILREDDNARKAA